MFVEPITAPFSLIGYAKGVPKSRKLTIWQNNVIFLAKYFVVSDFLLIFAS